MKVLNIYLKQIFIVSLTLSLALYKPVCAQLKSKSVPYMNVGYQLSDLQFNEVVDYSKPTITLKDLLGKWTVLYYWTEYCATCPLSFPKWDALQKKMGKDVQFLLVGYKDSDRIKKIYEKYKAMYGLNLPIAFDTTLFHKAEINGSPCIFVIDPKGKVRARTHDLEETDLNEFIKGGYPVLPRAFRVGENTLNDSKPFLLNGNGGGDSDYLYRSILTEWKDYMRLSWDFTINPRLFQMIGVDLNELYRFAYLGKAYDWAQDRDTLFGKFFFKPVLDLKDPSLFDSDRRNYKNFFCYSAAYPASKSSEVQVKERMKRDLQNYFGYEVHIEQREMPYFSLTYDVSKTSKKNTDPKNQRPLNYVLASLFYAPENSDKYWVLNETGLPENFKIPFEEDPYYSKKGSLASIKEQLPMMGFKLQEKKKVFKVLVISDQKNEN